MNELQSKHNLGHTKWYALISYYKGMRQQLFSVMEDQEYESLYLLTALEATLETSPIFIELKSACDPLVAALPEECVVYLSAPSEVPFNALIVHLRLRLNILFDGRRKGLLHYYHPRVASYFFGRSSENDTSAWLGPFTTVQFLSQCLDQTAHWMECGDGLTLSDNSTWLVTLSQDRALTEQYDDQEIVTWAAENNVEAHDWEIQKSATRFCDQQGIDAPELRVRLRNVAHRHQVNPRLFNTSNKQFSELNTQQKIEFIEQYLSREY
jgi:hypothetical protein